MLNKWEGFLQVDAQRRQQQVSSGVSYGCNYTQFPYTEFDDGYSSIPILFLPMLETMCQWIPKVDILTM